MQRASWLAQHAEVIELLYNNGLDTLFQMFQENAFQCMRRAAIAKDHDEIVRLNAKVATLLEIEDSVNAVLAAVRKGVQNGNKV